MVAFRAHHVLTGRQQHRNPAGIQPKQRPQQCRAHRPSRHCAPKPHPCLGCGGAPGYGKSYAAKRVVRAEIQRGAQAFIVDPDIAEWADALADIPDKAIIDMGGDEFGCCPLRLFPEKVAGGYWLDYMVPMMGLDSRSTAVQRLRPLLTASARRRLGITSTAALMNYIASIQAPLTGADTRPEHVTQLAADLQPVLIALQSWPPTT